MTVHISVLVIVRSTQYILVFVRIIICDLIGPNKNCAVFKNAINSLALVIIMQFLYVLVVIDDSANKDVRQMMCH